MIFFFQVSIDLFCFLRTYPFCSGNFFLLSAGKTIGVKKTFCNKQQQKKLATPKVKNFALFNQRVVRTIKKEEKKQKRKEKQEVNNFNMLPTMRFQFCKITAYVPTQMTTTRVRYFQVASKCWTRPMSLQQGSTVTLRFVYHFFLMGQTTMFYV